MVTRLKFKVSVANYETMLQFCEGHGVTFGHAMHPVTINTTGRGQEGRNRGWEAVRAKKGSHRQIKKCRETRAPSGCYVMTFSKMIIVSAKRFVSIIDL